MSKDEFITLKEKQGIKKEEVVEKWAEFEKQFKEQGMKDPELLERIKRRLQSWFVLQAQTPGVDCQGIFIGIKESDYGARKQYIAANEAYKKDAQAAMRAGLVNAEGKPIVQNGFRAGQIIDVKAVERSLLGVFKVGEGDFVKGELKTKEKMLPELFVVTSFSAIKNANKSKNDYVYLSATQKTSFKTENKMDDKKVISFLGQYFKDRLFEMRNLPTFIEENKGKFNEFAIIKGDAFSMIDDDRTKTDIITGEIIKKNNVLNLNSSTDAQPIAISCIAPADLKFNFTQGAEGVIAIGRPYLRKAQDGGEEQLGMTLYGFYAPAEYQITEKKGFVEPKVVEESEPEPELPTESNDGW